MDASSLKQTLINFEKKINKNQQMRMKYSSEPDKFMESEVALHAEINELYSLAASPELYPILFDSGSLESILGMVAHENTGVCDSVHVDFSPLYIYLAHFFFILSLSFSVLNSLFLCFELSLSLYMYGAYYIYIPLSLSFILFVYLSVSLLLSFLFLLLLSPSRSILLFTQVSIDLSIHFFFYHPIDSYDYLMILTYHSITFQTLVSVPLVYYKNLLNHLQSLKLKKLLQSLIIL